MKPKTSTAHGRKKGRRTRQTCEVVLAIFYTGPGFLDRTDGVASARRNRWKHHQLCRRKCAHHQAYCPTSSIVSRRRSTTRCKYFSSTAVNFTFSALLWRSSVFLSTTSSNLCSVVAFRTTLWMRSRSCGRRGGALLSARCSFLFGYCWRKWPRSTGTTITI